MTGTTPVMEQTLHRGRLHHALPGALILLATLVLGGCSSTADWMEPGTWFGPLFQDDTPRLAEAAGKAKPRPADNSAYPSLSDTPGAPQLGGDRGQVVAGLLADKANANYTEQVPVVANAQRSTAAAASSVRTEITGSDTAAAPRQGVDTTPLVADAVAEPQEALNTQAAELAQIGEETTDKLISSDSLATDTTSTGETSAVAALPAGDGLSSPPAVLETPQGQLQASPDNGAQLTAPTQLTELVPAPSPAAPIPQAIDARLSAPPPVQPTPIQPAPIQPALRGIADTAGALPGQAATAVQAAAPPPVVPAQVPNPTPAIPQPVPLATLPGSVASPRPAASPAIGTAVATAVPQTSGGAPQPGQPAPVPVIENRVALPVSDDQSVLAEIYRQNLTAQSARALSSSPASSFQLASRVPPSAPGANTQNQQAQYTDAGNVIVYNAAGVPVIGAGVGDQRYGRTATSIAAPAGTAVIVGGESLGQGTPTAAASGSEPYAVLHFANGSARLNNASRRQIRRLAQQLTGHNGYIRVVGHASQRTRNMRYEEHKRINFNISLDRANSVAVALSERGVQANRILVEARGDRDPQYHEFMPEGEAQNRRVEIYLE